MRDLLRSVGTAALEGFGFGALLYGSAIAGLHVLHNRLEGAGEAVVTWGWMVLIYGLWAALLFGGVAFLAEAFRGFFGAAAKKARRAPVFLPGIVLFNLLFWELYFLYGLTYDQVPAVAAVGPWRMLAFLFVAALVIAVVVLGASLLLGRVWRLLAVRGGLQPVAGVLAVVGLLASVLPPLFGADPRAGADGSAESAEPAAIETRDTGVSVVFVGLDGADWQVLRPMVEAGELPAFERMAAEGATAPLTTLADANSAVIWATIFTGASRRRHGVEDFYRIELPGLSGEGLYPVHRSFFQELAGALERTGLVRRTLVTRYSHGAVPWWEVADRAGLPIGVVDGYLTSFPAYRPETEGSYFVSYGADAFSKSLAQRGAKDVELFLQPPELFRELRDDLESGPDFVWQSNTLRRLLETGAQPRLLTFYTHEPDSAQHKFWQAYQPERYLGSPEPGKEEEILGLYREFDAFLAELRRTVGPETVIVVASDHGHSPTLVHKLFTQHRHGPPGILLMEGGPIRRDRDLADADVHDLFPTLLYLLGLPVPEDQPGRVLEEALDPAFLARYPVRTLPSYEFLDPGLAGGQGLDPERNRQELEKLKSLGYI